MGKLRLKRIYDNFEYDKGYRILVDRLWPRGISKEKARLDLWSKEIAPTTKLRKWFDHDIKKFEKFSQLYEKELLENENFENFMKTISKELIQRDVFLLYSAKDERHNQAIILKRVLEENIKKS